jgi:hypothetical protein
MQFIEQNFEYIKDIYNNYGKSNMDDYFFQYIQAKFNQSEKEFRESMKVPNNAMLPVAMNQLNVNVRPVNNPMMQQMPTNMPFYRYPQMLPNMMVMPNQMPLVRNLPTQYPNQLLQLNSMLQQQKDNIQVARKSNFA